MLLWHAIEETEHKAVAYDVYELTVGRGPRAYALRMATMAITSFFLWAIQTAIFYRLLRKSGLLFDLGGWRKLFHTLFFRPGFLTRLAPILFDYARPGFHPWQRDNRHDLEEAVAGIEAWR